MTNISSQYATADFKEARLGFYLNSQREGQVGGEKTHI